MVRRGLIWMKGHLPTRHSLSSNRWTRPFARYLLRPALWRFNRRSVPRAIAVGLLIAPIVPVAHTGVAALVAVPLRANIVIAAAITWLINPLTMPPFYYEAYVLGKALLHADTVGVLDAAGATLLGTLVLSILLAAIGYGVGTLGWRWRMAAKWRRRAWAGSVAGTP